MSVYDDGGLRRYDIEGRSASRPKRVSRKETEPKGVKGLSKQAMVVTMSENLTVAEIAGMPNLLKEPRGCNVAQHVAAQCNTLQHVATDQHLADCCGPIPLPGHQTNVCMHTLRARVLSSRWAVCGCSETCGAARRRGAADERRAAIGDPHGQRHRLPMRGQWARRGSHARVGSDDPEPTVRAHSRAGARTK